MNPGAWGRVAPTRSEQRGLGARSPVKPRIRVGEARELPKRMASIRKKKCFSPTRPAMGGSKPIGAMRWHRNRRIKILAAESGEPTNV